MTRAAILAPATAFLLLLPSRGATFNLTDNPDSPLSDLSLLLNEAAAVNYYLPGTLDDYGIYEGVNRLNLSLIKGGWVSGIQVDLLHSIGGETFVDPDYDAYDGIQFGSSFLDLEKVFLRGRFGKFSFEAGDIYHVLPLGIALNFRKYPSLDFDTSLRGGKFSLSSGLFGFDLVGGVVNPQNLSLLYTNYIQEFPKDLAVAGSLSLDLSPVRVEVHGSNFSYERDEGEARALDSFIGGGEVSFSALTGNLETRLNGDYFSYPQSEYYREYYNEEFPDRGYALYLTNILSIRGNTLTLEAKATKDTEWVNLRSLFYEYEYSTLPLLEYDRSVNENSSEAINSNDISGASLRYDYLIPGTLSTLYGSFTYLYDRDTELHSNEYPEHILHPFLGTNLRFDNGSYFSLNSGARKDFRTGEDSGADTFYYIDSDLFLPLISGTGMEIYDFIQRFESAPREDGESLVWIKGGATFSLTYLTRASLALRWEYSDDPFDTSLLFGGIQGNFINDYNFLSGEILFRPFTSMELKLFAGARRGGISCSGGQCRILPSFKGVKLESIFSF